MPDEDPASMERETIERGEREGRQQWLKYQFYS